MKRVLIFLFMVVPTLTSDKPSAHEYKKRPAAIRAMTDVQIDNYNLLEYQRRVQYALHLHQQWIHYMQGIQQAAFRHSPDEDYKEF